MIVDYPVGSEKFPVPFGALWHEDISVAVGIFKTCVKTCLQGLSILVFRFIGSNQEVLVVALEFSFKPLVFVQSRNLHLGKALETQPLFRWFQWNLTNVTGIGIRNVIDRLKLYYNLESLTRFLTIESQIDIGTKVALELPYEMEGDDD